jgi:hypothetical protein
MSKDRNPITGDRIVTKRKSKTFDDNFDAIFRQRKAEIDEQLAELEVEDFKENKDAM